VNLPSWKNSAACAQNPTIASHYRMTATDPDESNGLHRRVCWEQVERGKLSRTAELRTIRDEQKNGQGKDVQNVPGHAPSQFEVHGVVYDGQHTLLLTGELDIASRPVLGAALAETCTDGTTAVMLDLRKLTFMDSTGMVALLVAKKLCVEHGCDFCVILGQPRVLRVFAITGLLDRLNLLTDESQVSSELSGDHSQNVSRS
jgi:anti-sigma B factor antagonist